MCDYEEDQAMEIEALESIYPDSFKVISEKCFKLCICSEEDKEVEQILVDLVFTYTPSYPDEAPVYEVRGAGNADDEEGEEPELDEDLRTKICARIEEEINENLGTVMVYNIVAAVQELVDDALEEMKKKVEDEKERREKEEKEAEMKKCHGTPVTVASFTEWRERFIEEMRKIEEEKKKLEKKSKKLTGKEIFMRKGGDLEDDDEVTVGGESEAVEVDESLFEDLEDLEILDDEDFE